MKATHYSRRSILAFLGLTFALSWPVFILPLAFGQPGTPAHRDAAVLCWALAMWAPGMAAILTTRFVDSRPLGDLNLKRLGDRGAYLWAWLAPIALSIVTGILTWALQLGVFDEEFSMMRAALESVPSGGRLSIALVVAVQILFAVTLAPLINVIFAMGEELGWRGYLLPKLLHLGQWRAVLMVGLIWGFWHAPAILQGHNYPEHRLLGVFMMVVFCTLLGVFVGWLYLRTGSPWTPALAHASLNAVSGLPLMFLTDISLTYGGVLTSLVGWIPLAALVGWLVWTRRFPVGERESMDAPTETVL